MSFKHISEITDQLELFLGKDLGDLTPAHLLTDGLGVYGLACSNCSNPFFDRPVTIIIRPDRVEEAVGPAPILQPIPNVRLLRYSAESVIADGLFTALLTRAGFDRYRQGSESWWSKVPAVQDANRRRYFALKRSALAITNNLVRKALGAAPPEALKLARQFPASSRFVIYRDIVRSNRMYQLANTFPALALCIALTRGDRRMEAMRLVEAGARLRTVASLMDIPLAFRKARPGAADLALVVLREVENIEKLIYAALPATTAAQRRWFRAVCLAAHNLGAPYADWVARNCLALGNNIDAILGQVADISDWVRASYLAGVSPHIWRAIAGRGVTISSDRGPRRGEQHVSRPFSPDMSVATVRELNNAWHEAVALSDPRNSAPLPPPWRTTDKIGSLNIVPLTTAAEIAGEGRAMHHCVATLIPSVLYGGSYLFSARDADTRVATIEVRRSGAGVSIAQMRGPCNAILPKPVRAKLARWVGQRDKWRLPALKESWLSASPGERQPLPAEFDDIPPL